MKTTSPTPSQSGVALVLVLGFLVIISALAVAFFASVTTELRASRNFQSNVNTRQLQDSVVNLVEGQIRQATVIDPNDPGTMNRAWASQPGLLQTFGDGNGGASSSPYKYYKLYSSNLMTDSGAAAAGDYIQAWDQSPALWTDLNDPVMDPDPAGGAIPVPRFPVIDPRANNHNNPQATTTAPAVTGNLVEGFNYTPTASTPNGIVYSGGTNDARLPMPVRWIYVLRDGSLTTPTSGTGSKASFSAATNKPTKTNPIIGRVAFWTDDDTSKLNINVAAGSSYVTAHPPMDPAGNVYSPDHYAGSYWDTPRVNSTFDQGVVYQTNNAQGGLPLPNLGGLAAVQMLQNEFQRYPGHPSTTSLSLVFQQILTSEQLYQLTPRIQGGTGTSMGGTNRNHLAPSNVPGANTSGQVANAAVPLRFTRLFDSVDEFLFADKSNSGLTGPRRTNLNYINLPTSDGATDYDKNNVTDVTTLTPGLLDRLRFFLTAYNRSPDLNLLSHPRVSVWPVRSQGWADDIDPTKSGINAFDSLSLFCSTIGPSVFRYTGTNSDQPTSLPGSQTPYHYAFFRHEPRMVAGTTPPTIDLTKPLDIDLPRNKFLLNNYILPQLSMPIPGFGGGNFMSKYNSQNMSETLVEMFDYILAANLYDSTITNTGANPTNPFPFARNGIVKPSVTSLQGSGGNQLGMGRFPTICEATLLFYYAGSDTSTAGTATTTGTIYPPQPVVAATPPAVATPQKNETSGVLVITPPDDPGPHPNKTKTQVPSARYMRAALLLSTFNPMQGYGPIQTPIAGEPLISYEVSGLDSLTATGGSVSVTGNAKIFGSAGSNTLKLTLTNVSGDFWGGRNFGGFEGFAHTLAGTNSTVSYSPAANPPTPYPFMTPAGEKVALGVNPPTVPNAACDYRETKPPTFNLSGGTVTVVVKFGGATLQTIALKFPPALLPAPRGDDILDAEPFDIAVPATRTPTLVPANTGVPILADKTTPKDNNLATYSNGFASFAANGPQPYGQLRKWYWSQAMGSFDPNTARTVPSGANKPTGFTNADRTVGDARDFQARIMYVLRQTGLGSNSDNPATATQSGPATGWRGWKWKQIVQPGDTARSLVFCDMAPGNGTAATKTGDLRLSAITSSIPARSTGDGLAGFYPHPDYASSTQHQACTLRNADGSLYFDYNSELYFQSIAATTGGEFNKGNPYGNHVALGAPATSNASSLTGKQFPQNFAMAHLPRQMGVASSWVNGVQRKSGDPGDFDNGVGQYADGPFFNKQDEGNAIFAYINTQTGVITYPLPYFGNGSYAAPGSAFNSPNRQMPSPVMMGSLLPRAGSTTAPQGWETLCFCPNPAGQNHPGNDLSLGPRDHLLLDLFQMPIVQPYPISEPFSTAGRVNLNYQIQPFDYIERSTALRAVLSSERVSIMGANDSTTYYTGNGSDKMYNSYKGGMINENIRKTIDRQRTMNLISTALSTNGLFRSPSQICEIFLIPSTWANNVVTASDAQKQWALNGDLTGDNLREKPYADIFPRLTTKSNTYTIHMKVQSLRQYGNSSDFTTWDDAKDAVLGEYRGSSSIERYIDPSDRRFNPNDALTQANQDLVNPDIVTFASPALAAKGSLESMYRFRTVNTKLFAP